MNKILLTFDIEEYYHVNFKGFNSKPYAGIVTNLEGQVDKIIDICDQNNVKSTCFVLGSVAKEKPRIVKKLFSAGHEIASHGFRHKLVYNMTPREFKIDLTKTNHYLEDITGNKVIGFRAPSWSVKKENLEWYYNTLEEVEFKYSSSIYPALTFLFGIANHNQESHYPVLDNKTWNVLEIPVPLTKIIGKKIGFSGGFFFRLFPFFLIKNELESLLKKDMTPFIYLHPREFDPLQPQIHLPPLERFIHYYGMAGCEKKFKIILKIFNHKLARISDCLPCQEINQPRIHPSQDP